MKRILIPIIKNIPLFIISILLMGGLDFAYHQLLFHDIDAVGILSAYGEMIFMAYLICLCSFIFNKAHLKVIFYIALFLIYALSCYLLYAYSTDIAPNLLLLLFETNSKEISGFFATYLMTPAMLKTILILIVLIVITIIAEYYNKKITKVVDKPIFLWILTIFLLLGGINSYGVVKRYRTLSFCRIAYDAEVWKSNNTFYRQMPIPNLCYSLTAIHLAGQDLFYMIDATKQSLKSVRPVECDSLNIVLVIGESYNKYYAGLYGYSLDTTPFECEEQEKGNLYAFTHVKAPHNMTSIVLKNMFSCNNVHEEEKWHDFPFFPAIFKKAGYDVWLWDNQYQTNPNMHVNFTLNSILFNEQIQELSYTAYNKECPPYDDDLITDFEHNIVPKFGKHNLIIFHLNGQHRATTDQFPQTEENCIFSAKDIKNPAPYLDDRRRQQIADYDNATRYNDKVIKHIIDMVGNTNTILIYFSDHGEELYDYRDFYGRSLLEVEEITPELIKCQIEIPFIVWASTKWKKNNEHEWQNIGEAVDRDFTIDNVCHLLFRIGGINTSEYKPTRDLFSPEFKPQTKEIDMIKVLQ